MRGLKPCGLKKALQVLGATNIEIHKGYHERSGFFEKDGQLYYFSTADDRCPQLEAPIAKDWMDGELPVMYRTAEHRKDYIGGPNRWDFLKQLHERGYKLTTYPKGGMT